jgi:hypothetical protein
MRNRYRSAMYGLAATLAITTTIGFAAAGAANASTHKAKPALTPACTFNDYCSDPVFNAEFQPLYFINSNNAEDNIGNPINLGYANDNNPGEDWTVDEQGSVRSLYHLGELDAAMMVHYRHNFAAEIMYTPWGVLTDMCRGLARDAYEGERVTLQPCGSFPRTLWIIGSNKWPAGKHGLSNMCKGECYGGNELVSASGTNPSVPYILTAGGGVWGGDPTATLQVDMQTADDGIVNPGQLWCTVTVDYGGGTAGPPPVSPPTYEPNEDCFPGDGETIVLGATK